MLLLSSSVLLVLTGLGFFNFFNAVLYTTVLYNCVVEQKEHNHVSDLVEIQTPLVCLNTVRMVRMKDKFQKETQLFPFFSFGKIDLIQCEW